MVFLTMKKPLVLQLDDDFTATIDPSGDVTLDDGGDIIVTRLDCIRKMIEAYDARPKPLTTGWETLHPGVQVRKNGPDSVEIGETLPLGQDIVLTVYEMKRLIERLGEEA